MMAKVATNPIAIEMRPPSAVRRNRSRPNSSVPKGCSKLGEMKDLEKSTASGSASLKIGTKTTNAIITRNEKAANSAARFRAKRCMASLRSDARAFAAPASCARAYAVRVRVASNSARRSVTWSTLIFEPPKHEGQGASRPALLVELPKRDLRVVPVVRGVDEEAVHVVLHQRRERVPVDRHHRQRTLRAGEHVLSLLVEEISLRRVRGPRRLIDDPVVLGVLPVRVVVPRVAQPENEAVVRIREVIDPTQAVHVHVRVRRRTEELQVLLPLHDLERDVETELLPESLDGGRDLHVAGSVVHVQLDVLLRVPDLGHERTGLGLLSLRRHRAVLRDHRATSDAGWGEAPRRDLARLRDVLDDLGSVDREGHRAALVHVADVLHVEPVVVGTEGL